jgi:hypothetical protein
MIRPDDPWYPTNPGTDDIGVTIRLKLAAEMMKSPYLADLCTRVSSRSNQDDLIEGAFELADAMIERANREESTDKADRDEGTPG